MPGIDVLGIAPTRVEVRAFFGRPEKTSPYTYRISRNQNAMQTKYISKSRPNRARACAYEQSLALTAVDPTGIGGRDVGTGARMTYRCWGCPNFMFRLVEVTQVVFCDKCIRVYVIYCTYTQCVYWACIYQ